MSDSCRSFREKSLTAISKNNSVQKRLKFQPLFCIAFFMYPLDFLYTFLVLALLKNSEIPPTFLEMLISLSFNITIRLVFDAPAWFNASNAIPPVSAPVPYYCNYMFFSFFQISSHCHTKCC